MKKREIFWAGVTVVIGLSCISSMARNASQSAGSGSSAGHSTPPSREVRLDATKTSYESGMFKVLGTIENTGSESMSTNIFVGDVRVMITVLSNDGSTTLAEEPAFIAQKQLAPGDKSAFEALVSVPGSPSKLKYQIAVVGARRKE